MMTKQLDQLISSGIVAVVRKVRSDRTMQVIESLVAGGVSGIEITVDSEDAFKHIKEAKKQFGHQSVIGAGTVLDGHTAQSAIHAGAEFIFAPTLNKETIQVANRYGKIVIPGVFTPTEMLQAYEWGADVVKVFPANVLGSSFIKGVRGPLGHIPVMPTGGISLDNVAEFIKAGSVALGVGGSLIRKDYIENQDWESLKNLAVSYVKSVQTARN